MLAVVFFLDDWLLMCFGVLVIGVACSSCVLFAGSC